MARSSFLVHFIISFSGIWNILTVVGEAHIELGDFKKAISIFDKVSTSFFINHNVRPRIIDKLSRLHFWYGYVSEGRKLCENELMESDFDSVEILIFNPFVRIAQFWRKECEFEKAKRTMDISRYYDEDYKYVFNAMCNLGQSTKSRQKSIDDFMDEIKNVIENIRSFKDLRTFLNRNKELFELFPEDKMFFVDNVLPILKKKLNESFSVDFMKRTEALKNSLRVTSYLKRRFENLELIAPCEMGEIGGPKFSCHKGQES